MVTVIKDAPFLHAEHTVVLLFRVSTPISALSGEEQYVICYIIRIFSKPDMKTHHFAISTSDEQIW